MKTKTKPKTLGGHDGSWRQAWQVGTEEDPGPEAFSEPETTALLDLIKETSPDRDILEDVHRVLFLPLSFHFVSLRK